MMFTLPCLYFDSPCETSLPSGATYPTLGPIMNTLRIFLFLCASVTPALAQWQGYPTPGIPRTPDGKPNFSAPAPRTANGKPDLSGIWMAPRIRTNIADTLKSGDTIPFQ